MIFAELRAKLDRLEPMTHDTAEKAAVAAANTVLRVQAGSRLHGVVVDGEDDSDEMGLVIEPPQYVIGLRSFEQYEYRSAGRGRRSRPDDLDYIAFSLRKWAKLAALGSPSTALALFAPDEQVIAIAWPGKELRAHPELVVSRQFGARFLGYLERQRDGTEGMLPQRADLVSRYGYDVKYAWHALRLGYQGLELMHTGRITLPIPDSDRAMFLDVRHGRMPKDAALDAIDQLAGALKASIDTSPLPERPDHLRLNDWLQRTYRRWWDVTIGSENGG